MVIWESSQAQGLFIIIIIQLLLLSAAWQVLGSLGGVTCFVCSQRSWGEAQSNREERLHHIQGLSLSQVGRVFRIPRRLWRISTVWFTQTDEGAGLILCREFAWVAECNSFSLQQCPHSLSKCKPELSAGNARGSARGGQEGTARARQSFPSPGPGSADATSSICFKLEGDRRGQGFQKCWLLGFCCKSPGLLHLWRTGAEAKQRHLVPQVLLIFVVIMLEEENWMCNPELSQYFNALSYMKSMYPFQVMNAF